MNIIETPCHGVFLIEPKIYGDKRGYFYEVYSNKRFEESGIHAQFIQDNQSGSTRGTLRGLHFQVRHPQGKLVRAVVGELFDLIVDLRRSSPTYSRWYGVNLSAENKRQLWIPPGFAHGFYVLSEWAEFHYKVTDVYDPDAELTLQWNDPSLNISWPLINGQMPILSEKDQQGRPLKHLFAGIDESDPVFQ